MKQRIIGITGGIATGKTAVTNYLHQTYKVPVLDADIYAREAVQGSILQAIADRYGDRALLPDGSLNRRALGAIVFADACERAWLEAQIHPYVRDRLVQEAQNLSPATVVMAIPLLFEARMTALVTEIWVVSCAEACQLVRLMQRDSLSESAARMRLAAQMPLSEKRARADVVLENTRTLAALHELIDTVWLGQQSLHTPS